MAFLPRTRGPLLLDAYGLPESIRHDFDLGDGPRRLAILEVTIHWDKQFLVSLDKGSGRGFEGSMDHPCRVPTWAFAVIAIQALGCTGELVRQADVARDCVSAS